MPPHLHPRSRFTSSLFATTVFASFFVVALPHALPCPAPRVAYADGEMSDGTPRRRRRRKQVEPLKDEDCSDGGDEPETVEPSSRRECPVPKPGGLVGTILGFKESSPDDRQGKGPP
ncbi:hypothetical protein PVAG01_00752 [Phlyctema vagabunda]|uniref:Uncharacterized protein n=1 Tax=Phlyctema vagabunda TaxID=108571 RepID=A0ABR4PV41_9HELO